MANEGVDVVTCDQAKHLVPTGAWVGKKKWKTCFLSNGVRAPGRSNLLMHKYTSLHKQLCMQSEQFVLHKAVHMSWQ